MELVLNAQKLTKWPHLVEENVLSKTVPLLSTGSMTRVDALTAPLSTLPLGVFKLEMIGRLFEKTWPKRIRNQRFTHIKCLTRQLAKTCANRHHSATLTSH